MQLPVEVWRHIFTYLTWNGWIEISCVFQKFHHFCANNRFYVKKFNQSKRIFRDRSWLLCHYKQLCKSFYYSLFRKLATYVPIENLHPARKIIHHRLYFSLLPFCVWKHLFQCCRSQYESDMCLFCTKLYLKNKKICNVIEKKLTIDVLDYFPVQLTYGVISDGFDGVISVYSFFCL